MSTGNETTNDPNIPSSIQAHPAWHRLNDQIKWYDSKSNSCQRKYKGIKISQIALAVFIPLTAFFSNDCARVFAAIAGTLIALGEGIQQLNQYSTLWITYRSTAERLKHEKYLFLSAAGPFADLTEAQKLVQLSERVEEHVSTEHANWFNEARRAVEKDKKH
jgi:hypothetical protein